MAANTSAHEIPLDRLEPGSWGVVLRVEGNSGIHRRLLDLGFVPETPVRALRKAPLGDPAAYEIRGFQICLRSSEALRIWIRPGPA